MCKNYSVRKIVNDRLLKTLVSALPSGMIWVDVPSQSVVPVVANRASLSQLLCMFGGHCRCKCDLEVIFTSEFPQ